MCLTHDTRCVGEIASACLYDVDTILDMSLVTFHLVGDRIFCYLVTISQNLEMFHLPALGPPGLHAAWILRGHRRVGEMVMLNINTILVAFPFCSVTYYFAGYASRAAHVHGTPLSL